MHTRCMVTPVGDLEQLQQRIAAVRNDRGFTTDPLRLLSLLTEEVGEVAGELKKTWSKNYEELQVSELGDELADVFVLITALATSFEIDLADAVEQKFFNADSKRSWATSLSDDASDR